MKKAKTLTFILAQLFIGLIIGNAIKGNSSGIVCAIILLIVDIIVGNTLQYLIEKKSYKDNWNNLSFEQKREKAHNTVERTMQEMRDKGIDIDGDIERFCDEFNREHHLGCYSNKVDEDNQSTKNDLE